MQISIFGVAKQNCFAVAVLFEERCEICRSVCQLLDRECNVFDNDTRASRAYRAHGWEETLAYAPKLSLLRRFCRQTGWNQQIKALHNPNRSKAIQLIGFQCGSVELDEQGRRTLGKR